MTNSLPGYAPRLDALHRALADDFGAIIGQMQLQGDESVLDAGCGDGFFTGLLAEHLEHGQVIGLDTSQEFLQAARGRLQPMLGAQRVRLVEGDVNNLPFDSRSLDVVFSAHSMQSYPSVPHVLQEFRRVLRPGGRAAILETDNVHSIMLSWPPHVELAIRQAEHREIGDEDSYIGTYFPRFAERLLSEAGFTKFHRQYVLIQRQHPCGDALAEYLKLYLQNLLTSTADELPASVAKRVRQLASPDSEHFLPGQPNFFFGSLQVLITAEAGQAVPRRTPA